MLSLEKKLYFIHIPKTGGTSIECLYSYIDRDENNRRVCPIKQWFLAPLGYPTPRVKKRSLHHMRLRDIEKAAPILNTFKVFTLVRNPYDRFVSAFLQRVPVRQHMNPLAIQQAFRDFALTILKMPHQELFEIYSGHFDTMTNMLRGQNKVYIFKNERMHILQKWLRKQLDEPRCKIPHKNKTNIVGINNINEFYRQLYTPQIQEMVLNIYKDDFQAFNYSTDIYNYDITDETAFKNIC